VSNKNTDSPLNEQYAEYEGPAADASMFLAIYCLSRGYHVEDFLMTMGTIFTMATREMAGHTFDEGLQAAFTAVKATLDNPYRDPTPLFGDKALPNATPPTPASEFN